MCVHLCACVRACVCVCDNCIQPLLRMSNVETGNHSLYPTLISTNKALGVLRLVFRFGLGIRVRVGVRVGGLRLRVGLGVRVSAWAI